MPTSACGLADDYTATSGGVGVAGETFVSRLDGGADPALGCKFELAQYAQDADCAEHTENCAPELRCAGALVDVANPGNVQSVCIPAAACGIEGQYEATGGTDPQIQGHTFRTTTATVCTENPVKIPYAQDDDCSVDPNNCGLGLRCA